MRAPLDVPRGKGSIFIVVGVAIMESEKGRERERERGGRERAMNELQHMYTKA